MGVLPRFDGWAKNGSQVLLGIAIVIGLALGDRRVQGQADLGQASSIGVAGVDALRLHSQPFNLKGRKIAIGQIEIGRPSLFGIDKSASQGHRSTQVWRAFFRNGNARSNTNVDPHAQNVAGIMVSADKLLPGVAPEAQLYSAAIGTMRRSGQPEECATIQHMAQQNGGDVRAVNLSFGESLREDPRPNAILDGNALLTLCLDWSARVHNVTYVVAGNQGKGGIPIPTDNFSGLNVAFSNRQEGIYRKVDFANLGDPTTAMPSRIIGLETNVGNRRSINLLAPGHRVAVLNPDGRLNRVTGTSFAAPHVTATIALLQEWGDRQLRNNRSGWTLDARRQEVMKAVLMNAADKLQDTGDGLRLGMSRTVWDKSNRDWTDSDAYRDPRVPLHIQMGAGHLNTYRAYLQFSAGQQGPENSVAAIGWDYRTLTTPGQPFPHYRDYVLSQSLPQNSMVAITLTWNRRVELLDANRNEQFDIGEEFRDRGLNNLDLYLMRVEDNDIQRSVAASISDVDSTEHIFAPIPSAGHYKIRVVYRQQAHEAVQPYALAWWTAGK